MNITNFEKLGTAKTDNLFIDNTIKSEMIIITGGGGG